MKWMEKLWRKEIDERQQADLNRVTGYGYWIAFYCLLLAVIVEGPILRRPFLEWVVEWGIFMVLAIYEVIACIRIGVWAPCAQNPSVKGSVIWSLAGGAFFAALFSAASYLNWEAEMRTAWNVGILFLTMFLWMSISIFVVYLIAIAVFMRRRKKMEDAMEKEEQKDEN